MAESDVGSETTDAALARRIVEQRARDAEAELCRRFAPRVRSFGLRHLPDASAADDLVQRVLMLTLEKLRNGEVREPDRIASFILGAARLTARSMRRQERGTEVVENDHPLLASAATAAREPVDRDLLAACLGRLTERERSVIVLSFFQQATAPEIGTALGIESGNVRVIRHRALGRLRQWLDAPAGEAP